MSLIQSKKLHAKSIQDFPIVHLDNISVTYPGIKALDKVSCSINRGEIVFVTGVSGAGKSSLLSAIAGDINIESGMSHCAMAEGDFVAQVFQETKLLEDLTLYENLLFSFDKAIHHSKKQFEQELNDIASYMGIQNRLDIKASKANGGLKQMIALTRALLSKPTLILCDEPTSSCDSHIAMKFFEVLSFYNSKKGMTVIWASHNRDLVKQFPGRLLHLDGGKLVYSGHACFI